MEFLRWDIYEIRSSAQLQGMMLRGRLRRFANQQQMNFLVENDEGGQLVRFAIILGSDPQVMIKFMKSILSDAVIEKVLERVSNPVLSKLKVNNDDRY